MVADAPTMMRACRRGPSAGRLLSMPVYSDATTANRSLRASADVPDQVLTALFISSAASSCIPGFTCEFVSKVVEILA